MHLTLLKAKLHQARVTLSELEYEGSCAIDGVLLDAAGICEYEQIQIYNLANGNRFTTYAIRGEEGSGMISVNGAAAYKAQPGDRIIICSYAQLEHKEAAGFKPKLVYLNENNQITHTSDQIPVQVA
ncbi:Aspartate 1-decarboxylase [hydrothermal vent metagenome]|uniref:Aspartate 1-decarboxylase n=1 Tax=hydrothermal vent metagenome TaxID=652676 RepID=A0A3B0X9C4_9ZZZZ